MLDRSRLVEVFHAAVGACDPAARVRAAMGDVGGARRFGVAAGKAAVAMARGAGRVERGVVIAPAAATLAVPEGWRVVVSAHPFADERSVAAARAAREIVDAASAEDVVLALISGGASALIEEPRDGVTIEQIADVTRDVMASGASIVELNAVRSQLSRIKRGGLIAGCKAPVVTLAISDVIGDALAVIGSGPTIGPWMVEYEYAYDHAYDAEVRARDTARVIAPMGAFADAAVVALWPQAWLERVAAPLTGEVAAAAQLLADMAGTVVAWGEPTQVLPRDHGSGGRMQQLALYLAKRLRGTQRIAMCLGSDGIDGPPPAHRPAPAGAIVDGATWDEIGDAAAEHALARCDAGTVLAAVGALVVTGPTGINHADLVVIGDGAQVL